MLSSAIALLQQLGVWTGIQIAVTVAVAVFVYERFVKHN
jgi:hypothetical protein